MSTIVSAPAPVASASLLNAEEFAARYANQHAELIKGVVKELPMPWPKHGKICLTIGRLIGNFADEHDLGHTMSNDSWVRTGSNPDTVRGGDICFFSYDRLPKGDVPDGLLPNIPDLVVEVRSPSDRWTELFTKVVEYLVAGVRVVVIIDADSRTASVYRPDTVQQTLYEGDDLTVADVLPGFTTPVRRLFE